MSDQSPVAEGVLQQVVEQLRVLGQVVRLRLIECLAQGYATPQELADDLGLSQQNVSKHLQVLYRAGFVARKRDGTSVLYSLADEGPVKVLDVMVGRESAQIAELSRLAREKTGADGREPDRAADEGGGS